MKWTIMVAVGTLLVALWAGAVFAEDSRFVFSEDTVQDRQTGLVWLRDADVWREITWKDAQELIKVINREKTGGYTDWRIPGKEELEALLAYASSSGYSYGKSNSSPDEFFNKMGFNGVRPSTYWTSTPDDSDPNKLWHVDVKYGRTDVILNQGYSFFVWPVRGKQRGK